MPSRKNESKQRKPMKKLPSVNQPNRESGTDLCTEKHSATVDQRGLILAAMAISGRTKTELVN